MMMDVQRVSPVRICPPCHDFDISLSKLLFSKNIGDLARHWSDMDNFFLMLGMIGDVRMHQRSIRLESRSFSSATDAARASASRSAISLSVGCPVSDQ